MLRANRGGGGMRNSGPASPMVWALVSPRRLGHTCRHAAVVLSTPLRQAAMSRAQIRGKAHTHTGARVCVSRARARALFGSERSEPTLFRNPAPPTGFRVCKLSFNALLPVPDVLCAGPPARFQKRRSPVSTCGLCCCCHGVLPSVVVCTQQPAIAMDLV